MASRRLFICLQSRQYCKSVSNSYRQLRRLQTCEGLCNDKKCNEHHDHVENVKSNDVSDDSTSATPETIQPSRLSAMRRRQHRPTLSVFDRVSQMLPKNFKTSVHVGTHIRHGDERNFQNYADDKNESATTEDVENGYDSRSSSAPTQSVARQQEDILSDDDGWSDTQDVPQGVPFKEGELIVAERENSKRHDYLKMMFNLDVSKHFTTKHGGIKHTDIIGRYPGDVFLTSRGVQISLHRATLEDYILYMKRTPVISYPKDCITMCMLIDANPGDTILEAGAGSGGMTLFLSRAVGHTGHVHSFEVNEKHHGRAVKNFHRWLKSWNLSHEGNRWPSNVIFHHQRLQDGEETLGNLAFDGAILDMENPHLAIPFVAKKLKAGRAIAIYLANLTQVIETLEYIDTRNVPLETCTVMEVSHRTWLVQQAKRHSGEIVTKVNSDEDEIKSRQKSNSEDDNSGYSSSDFEEEQFREDTSPVYLAKPTYWQHPHTAFLLKLRKCQG